jgi:hypothetical protein
MMTLWCGMIMYPGEACYRYMVRFVTCTPGRLMPGTLPELGSLTGVLAARVVCWTLRRPHDYDVARFWMASSQECLLRILRLRLLCPLVWRVCVCVCLPIALWAVHEWPICVIKCTWIWCRPGPPPGVRGFGEGRGNRFAVPCPLAHPALGLPWSPRLW